MKRNRRRKKKKLTGKTLKHTFEQEIKFSEVDSMGVVWHGHYVRYLEDGREAWGKKYGLTYLDVYEQDFLLPVISLNCEYFSSLKYGDTAIIETTMIDSPAAKLYFEYKIYRKKDKKLSVIAESTQVFLDQNRELYIAIPPFIETWKKKINLI